MAPRALYAVRFSRRCQVYVFISLYYFSGDGNADKFVDGLDGATKLIRGLANFMDKGTGTFTKIRDRLAPSS